MIDESDQRADTLNAAERTLMAWVRTGLAMMGFGLIVARFGFFLREMTALRAMSPQQHSVFSLWIGTIVIILGAAVSLGAGIRHWFRIRRIERRQPLELSPWSLGMVVAILLSMSGLAMVIYLVFGFDH